MDAHQKSMRNNTNRGVCDVIDHDAQSARRVLSERRVAEPELLDQECVVTEQGSDVLRARERCDRIGLGVAVVRLWVNLVRGGMHARCSL
jgi:hypothetical protein